MSVALDVDAATYDSAAEALGTASATVRTAHTDLTGALAGLAAMGGDDASSEDWVAGYDPAARDLEAAIADLATAWGTLAQAASTSGANHRDADSGSVYRGPGGASAGPSDDGALGPVSSSPPPSALGGDAEGMPDGWDLVVDHLQGWTWPSADTGKLRDAAAAWRSAGGMLGYTPADGATARGLLGDQRSPEIALATSAIGDVETAARDLASACEELAQACEDYATQVETTRNTIKGLLRDLVIEIAATAAVSGLASLVTFGGAAAAGAAVAVQRAISCARRIVAALMALKAIRAAATLVRSVGRIRAVRSVLQRFRGFRGRRSRPSSTPGGPPVKPRPTTPSGTHAPPRVRGPDGEDLPGVPEGATPVRPSDTGKGWIYDVRGAEGLDPRVVEVRVMDPVTGGPHPKPNGYVVYLNEAGQTVNPVTGKTTIGKKDPYAHIELPGP
ncbi:MAG: hypothetical protein JWN84_2894 [Nocardioides sp.]|nr:hypothetical protein [Nocardioides sp.]